MLISGIQRVILLSCLILSMALFLPKLFLSAGKEKLLLHSEAGPGRVPALRPSRGAPPGADDQSSPPSLHPTLQTPETFSQVKTFQKSPLLTQVAPIYGFAMFLYIIYLFFKLTHKDQAAEAGEAQRRFSTTAPEAPEDETAQLQTRFKQMEGQRERRGTAESDQNPTRCRKYRSRREERKLQHLMKFSHMLVEGRMLEDVTPEVEAEETPYSADWEGYPEETFPQYEVPLCRRRYPSVILEEPYGDVPTPEELAERMERENEEEEEKNEKETKEVKDESSEDGGMDGDGELEKGEERDDDDEDGADEEVYKQDEEEEEEVGEDQPCLAHRSTDEKETPHSAGNQKEGERSSRRRQITFSKHRHIFRYPQGGAVGCNYEDEEVEEDVPEDDDDYDDDDDDDVEKDKQDEDDDTQEMEMERKEDDPLMEAEHLGFTCDPEEQEVDLIDFLLTYKAEAVIISEQSGAAEAPGLRMRCKNQHKEN